MKLDPATDRNTYAAEETRIVLAQLLRIDIIVLSHTGVQAQAHVTVYKGRLAISIVVVVLGASGLKGAGLCCICLW